MERSGLCMICQDQEANIAIVDCGHLAMCQLSRMLKVCDVDHSEVMWIRQSCLAR
ncbi:uncharacterized protein EDB91DRAFT_1176681 [Suillus paluster]|uniref:uncharacterized protein n=1 Tax=Suillus paluster TaxID=48578 RepID=UPI001B873E88|nr:uncharacterized protein EDB91DRAFT_1176681 [Suillus paluster]KAG1721123.1 hypothetical protein EDB91DRAFT_1176681 [Suillus paluster]